MNIELIEQETRKIWEVLRKYPENKTNPEAVKEIKNCLTIISDNTNDEFVKAKIINIRKFAEILFDETKHNNSSIQPRIHIGQDVAGILTQVRKGINY